MDFLIVASSLLAQHFLKFDTTSEPAFFSKIIEIL